MIKYRTGKNYELVKEYQLETLIEPEEDAVTDTVELTKEGLLTIKKGFAWDGASGPAFDTRSFMRASLVHDALYYLMRQEVLDRKWRDEADLLMKEICLADGMWKVRAWWCYRAVRRFGESAATIRHPILTAP